MALVFLSVSAFGVLPLGCGQTTTLGDARIGDPGGNGGGAPDGGNALGSAGVSGAAGQGGDSGQGGASGQGGSGADAGAGGTSGDAGLPCKVPRPAPKPDPTQEELDRATLIHDFCRALADQDCLGGFARFLGSISVRATGCGLDDRIVACEQDSLYYYTRLVVPFPDCEDEWRALLNCQIAADHTPEQCAEFNGIGANSQGDPTGTPCDAAGATFEKCVEGHFTTGSTTPTTVTGSRGTCQYAVAPESPNQCSVDCYLKQAVFSANCSNAPGLPFECFCRVNAHALPDNFADRYQFFASDCRDAAQTVADGECINRLDCCFTYFSTAGTEYCECTSDPGGRGYPSCEAAAREGGGKVVAICPQYKVDAGGCWPPSSCP
jgi:hypothetical protein